MSYEIEKVIDIIASIGGIPEAQPQYGLFR